MVARLALAGICGGDPRRIEATITLADWVAFSEEWAENPPAHIILAKIHLKPHRKSGPKGLIEQPITRDWDWDSLGPLQGSA
jgi:hypothetical protein